VSEILTYVCLFGVWEADDNKNPTQVGCGGGLRKQNRWSELWKYFESEEQLMVVGAKKETAESLKEGGGGI